MSEFQIVITRREPNPDYDVEVKEWESRTRYGNQMYGATDTGPRRFTDVRVLDTVVDDVAFAAIRKAALEQL